MSKTIQIRTIGDQLDVALITLRGFLDSMSSYDLQRESDDLIQRGIYKFIVNFEQLEYLSSAGIETFHTIAQKLQSNEGSMVFVSVPEKIYKVLEIIGSTTFFRIKDSVRDAMKELETA
jgi:anti-sigma B factor antagonist